MIAERELGLLADKLKPYIVAWMPTPQSLSSGTSSSGLVSHDIGGSYHQGTLRDAQGPQFALTTGARAFTGSITVVGNVVVTGTVDGVDISAHASNPSAHHAPVTSGTLISVSGQQVSLANGSAQYQVPVTGASPYTPTYTALSSFAGAGIGFSGGQFVVGVAHTGATGLSVETDGIRLTSSNAPTGASILASDSGGGLTLQDLTVVHAVKVSDDADSTSIIGRLKLFSVSPDNGAIAHYDHATATNYGWRQTNAGTVVHNAPTGQLISHRINNASVMDMDVNGLTMVTGKRIEANYVSGWGGSGYRVDTNLSVTGESFAEFDNLSVRGTMNVYELIINQIRATNGTEIISSAGKIDTISGSNWTFEDPEGNALCPFLVNDLVIIQDVDLNASTVVKRIVRRVTAVTGATITVTAAAGGPTDVGTPTKGDTVVRFGNSSNAARQGVVLLTSDFSNSPYIDVISGVTSWADWTGGTKTKTRIGLLSGLSIGTANEYGIAAGDGFTTADSYFKVSTAGATQNNIASTWKTGGANFLTIDETNGIRITANTAYVSSRAYTFYDTTDLGGMYMYSHTLGRGLQIKTVPTAKPSQIYVLAEANAGQTSQLLIDARTGSNSAQISLDVSTGGARTISHQADTHTIASYSAVGAVKVDNRGFYVHTDLGMGNPLSYSTSMGVASVRAGLFSTSPYVVFDDGSGATGWVTSNGSSLSLGMGSNPGISIGSTSISVSLPVTSLDIGTATPGTDLNKITARHASGAVTLGLATSGFGMASAFLANASLLNESGSMTASGTCVYRGTQYTGNVTTPGMLYFDANANFWGLYIGPSGLAEGASITWQEKLRVDRYGNLTLNGMSASGGWGVFAMKSCIEQPTTTPVGGGIQYVLGGALYFMGGNGTITKIANA